MAAGNFTLYDAFKFNLASKAIDLASDNFRMILLTSSYTPQVPTDSEYSNVSADETSGTGYTTGGVALGSLSLYYTADATTLPVIVAGGTGYAASSTFNVTVSGGTSTTAAVVSVTTNASGVVTTVNSVVTRGNYSVLSTNPVATTGGTGTGLTLTMTWDVAWSTGAGTWTNSTITAKYAVVVHTAAVGAPVSTDLLCGYVDLNVGGGSVSSTNASFTVTPNAVGLFTMQ